MPAQGFERAPRDRRDDSIRSCSIQQQRLTGEGERGGPDSPPSVRLFGKSVLELQELHKQGAP